MGSALALMIAVGSALALPAAWAAAQEGPPLSPAPPLTQATALLPDLVQLTPYHLRVERVTRKSGERHRLGFASAVSNAGDGQLIVRARRTADEPTMSADQIIRLRSGGHARRRAIGTLHYARFHGHQHWHYQGFERYELRDVATGALISPDRKSGFCLGDRFDETGWQGRRRLPAEDRFLGLCGMRRPNATRMVQGISPGYGDEYLPHLEGQYVDITDVPPGPYVLVHRVNADRSLVESRYTNNASSVRIRLTVDAGGRRRIRVMAQCPGFDTCPRRSPAIAAPPGS